MEKLTNKSVQVKNQTLNIRPLMEKNKRVVISNVSPIIPHEILTDVLRSRGITLASQMNYIKARLNKPGRSHILSFRRQFYIKEEDVHLLLESLQVNYDNTTYWVYLSTDSASCFICKQNGHIANCKSYPNQTMERTTNITPKQTNIVTPSDEIPVSDLTLQNTNNPIKKRTKRPPSASTSTEGTLDNLYPKDNPLLDYSSVFPSTPAIGSSKFKKPETKKTKLQSNTVSDEYATEVLPARRVIEHSLDPHVLGFDQFKKFLEKSRGRTNSLEIAFEFTQDIEGLIKMIDIVYQHLEDRSLKARSQELKRNSLDKVN